MSRTLRGRLVAYDNISSGNATGAERTIAGDTVSPVEIHGGGFQTSTSTGDVWHSNVNAGASVTDQVSPGKVPENILVAGEDSGNEALATSDHPGFTS